MNGLFDVSGKVVLITGSSQGIGYTLAKGFGNAGAKVILNGRNEDKLKLAVEKLASENIDVYAAAFDVCDSDSINKNIYNIISETGPIDILVNNAGITIRGPLEDFDEGDWQKILDINLTGVFKTTKAVIKNMIERKSGKIINICSVQSDIARPTIAPYTASKGGLKMLTKAMATDWGKYNIQVNGLAPGYFETELTKSLVEDPKFNAWLCARTPANRWGDPEELVGAAIFLSSKASSYVNGHILHVNGGMTACV